LVGTDPLSKHDDYQAAVALLRVIYDMLDRRKGCETEQVTDGASQFQKRHVELELRSGIPTGMIRSGWLRRLFGRRHPIYPRSPLAEPIRTPCRTSAA
jgi:hypothetical protein